MVLIHVMLLLLLRFENNDGLFRHDQKRADQLAGHDHMPMTMVIEYVLLYLIYIKYSVIYR
jgi:hypothetical protein